MQTGNFDALATGRRVITRIPLDLKDPTQFPSSMRRHDVASTTKRRLGTRQGRSDRASAALRDGVVSAEKVRRHCPPLPATSRVYYRYCLGCRPRYL